MTVGVVGRWDAPDSLALGSQPGVVPQTTGGLIGRSLRRGMSFPVNGWNVWGSDETER